MSQHYSDPARENDPHALPDIEVFHMTASDFTNSEEGTRMHEMMENDHGVDADSLAGYYWQSCFPGCLPDGDPIGPFDTRALAVADAQGEEM